MGWLHGFLKKYQRLNYFDDTWENLLPYQNVSIPNKPYRQVSQWQGKEMRSFGRIILPALAASLTFSSSLGRPPTAKVKAENENRDKIFSNVLRCTGSLIDFHLMAQYKCHTPKTLSQMQGHFAEFHETKAVFLEFRGLKSAAVASKLAVQHLRDHSNGATSCVAEDEESLTGVAARIISNKRKKDNVDVWRKERDARQEAIEKTAHFKFMKMHLPLHYRAHVEQLGAIGPFSTESGESAHKRQVKEGYNHSNQHDVSKQIIEYYTRVSALSMREQNLRQLIKEGIYSNEVKAALNLLSPAGKVPGDVLFFTFAN
jgi:hypothetical protein